MVLDYLPWGLVVAMAVFGIYALRAGPKQPQSDAGDVVVQVAVAQLEVKLEQAQLQNQQLQEQLQESLQQLAQLQQELSQAVATNASLQTQVSAQQAAHQLQLQQLEQNKASFEAYLKQFAEQSLKQQSSELSTKNQDQLGHLLNPLKQQLGDFRKKVDDVYDKEARDRAGLTQQINSLLELNNQLSSDAINLTKALKGDNKAQGNWGEMVLEQVLEQSGLRKDHEYHLQVNLTQTDGKRLQPDAIIHMPEKKDVVVDSKVTLVAYERYQSAESEDQRNSTLSEHLASVKAHIKGLSGKSYEAAEGVRSLDYVLLFIPIESAYMLALQADSELFISAMKNNIMIVSPATLLMVLRTIHNIWRYEHQSQNAKEISRQAEEMHKKLVDFVTSMDGVGNHLVRAQDAYDTAHKRLTSGRGNLINRAQSIVKLGGIQPKKALPDALIEAAEEAGSALEPANES
ncbi:MAG: DNA recombination protein RmuC [Oceanospirillaceae bacterium]|jgi:DNA recombination protein RmuC|nr:DNA recombination protein RmuC [Oceanospirillaceae bacterium]MBT4442568.1 DNA recombination protein RmuC [Oceanospirillaceae bacterium]MBT6076902.1 DNA recombination protein RmuC [Oceanospirillaceae bacterium]MBT7331354.1 DNA recombination protein RmuC [Oceanospirillaceae bacterium]